MNLEFWWIGKTTEKYLTEGINVYKKRLKHYCKFSINEFKDVKVTKNSAVLIQAESELVLSKLDNNHFLILLDEKGVQKDSVAFARLIEKWNMNSSYKKIVFLVAGAYGASPELKKRANYILSLSDMTFSHQMIRLFFLEQLYRGHTILRNEKYHNN